MLALAIASLSVAAAMADVPPQGLELFRCQVLAMDVLKSASAALAPTIFGVWMDFSGSLLANWWNRRDVQAQV